MNLEELVAWGLNTLRYLEYPRPLGSRPVDRAVLTEKLGVARGVPRRAGGVGGLR